MLNAYKIVRLQHTKTGPCSLNGAFLAIDEEKSEYQNKRNHKSDSSARVIHKMQKLNFIISENGKALYNIGDRIVNIAKDETSIIGFSID